MGGGERGVEDGRKVFLNDGDRGGTDEIGGLLQGLKPGEETVPEGLPGMNGEERNLGLKGGKGLVELVLGG